VTVVRRVDQKIEGRIWPRIDSEAGGRYVGIPLHRRERGFTTVQGTGCGTVDDWGLTPVQDAERRDLRLAASREGAREAVARRRNGPHPGAGNRMAHPGSLGRWGTSPARRRDRRPKRRFGFCRPRAQLAAPIPGLDKFHVYVRSFAAWELERTRAEAPR
jgi:hypothetical protein